MSRYVPELAMAPVLVGVNRQKAIRERFSLVDDPFAGPEASAADYPAARPRSAIAQDTVELLDDSSKKRKRVDAFIYGPAMAQGSKRIGRAKGNGKPITLDANPRLKPWRQSVSEAMMADRPERPWDCAVFVHLVVAVQRPKAHFGTGKNAAALKASAPKTPPTGLDLDKIARAIGDAGTSIWWRDDSRIASWAITRRYVSDGEPEGLSVSAWPMDEVTTG